MSDTPIPVPPADLFDPPDGAAAAPDARRRGKIRAAYKDLNARGKGTKTYRMAVDGARLVWIDRHPECIGEGRRLSTDDLRASGRHDSVDVEVPEGLIVVEIDKCVGGRGGGTTYRAGRTWWSDEKGRMCIEWEENVHHVGIKRVGDAFVHVLAIDGERQEFAS